MGALDGILVVALEQAVAAPLCTARLAEGGARVIKIERAEGDFARGYDHAVNGDSAYFVWLNRGKESLVLDIKQPDDAALKDGFFYEATVFADMQPHMRLAQEEVFGPIMSVFKWRDEDALWTDVNGVDFGLTGSIWTQNLNTAHRAAKRIHTGYVWINNASQHFMGAPFGGVKQSGIGREECFAELLEFTYTKNINVKLG